MLLELHSVLWNTGMQGPQPFPGDTPVHRFPRRAVLAAVFASVVAPLAVHAQPAYPAQPIKLVVPFPPGGGTDTVARLLVERMQAANGWVFVVDNKAGAGGNIGMDAVAKSKGD